MHCLQKERGASCAYSVSPGLFEENVVHARLQTDTAVRLWGRVVQRICKIPILDALQKVRRHVNRDVDTWEEDLGEDIDLSVGEYHRVLVLYNTMIGTILHSFLKDSKKSSSMTGHKKSSSITSAITSHKKVRRDHRRCQSDTTGFASVFQEIPTIGSSDKNDYEIKSSHGVKVVKESRTPALLNLLECFVGLKESTGLERALLSSMFAMGAVDNRLMNDLVLEVENQHKLISELQNLQDMDGNLLLLIRENVGLPPSMERLQSFILSEFDLEGFQQEMNHEEVWNLITVYMDKLHSLELLIVEEVESSLSEDNTEVDESATTSSKQDSTALLNQVFTTNGMLQDLEAMPAEEVKARLLEFMPSASGEAPPVRERTPSPPSSPAIGTMAKVDEDDDMPAPSEWDINLYDIQFQKRIGRGTAGTTYLAKWSGQEVAVKVAAITDMGLDGWKTEVKSLRKLHHPNIIRLLGSVYNETPLTYCLVLEYCAGGDLQNSLQKPTNPKFFFKIASDIAHGMAYLHNRGIIHRDIKPANVLINGDVSSNTVSAKVTDFGVAAIEFKPDMTSETGTYRWMAPEVIRHHPYSEKADCYSYGILLWQLITREDPFAMHSPLEAAGKVALELARPEFPNDTPAGVKNLIESCWAEDPDWRCSFEEISKNLGEGLGLSPDEQKWIQATFGHPVYTMDDEESEEEVIAPILLAPAFVGKVEEKPASGLMKLFGRRSSSKVTT